MNQTIIINALYILANKYDVDLRKMGIFPTERIEAVRRACLINRAYIFSELEIEPELTDFFRKYVLWRENYGK